MEGRHKAGSRPRTSPVWQMEAGAFRALIARCQTLTEIMDHFGLQMRGHNYRTLMRRIEEEGIDIAHIRANRYHPPKRQRPLAALLTADGPRGTSGLKRRLLTAGLLAQRCADCGLGPEWNGRPLSLHLDHISGDARDNRLENLRLLCPNCHSQTETYAGRKAAEARWQPPSHPCQVCGKIKPPGVPPGLCTACANLARRQTERPPRDVLMRQVAELGYTGAGRLYGVSDNAIRKWLRQPDPPDQN